MSTTIQMKLLKNHEHKGASLRHGEVVSVSLDDANIMINIGVAEKYFPETKEFVGSKVAKDK